MDREVTRVEPSSLSFAELHARLRARQDDFTGTDNLDLDEAFRYLVGLPSDVHTSDTVNGLIQIARSFFNAARPIKALEAATHASSIATRLEDKTLLCHARLQEGMALTDLGRFSEATVAAGKALAMAREIQHRWHEISAIATLGQVSVGMAQWNVAVRYYARARDLSAETNEAFLELLNRINLADCFLQLRDADSGLRALGDLWTNTPKTRRDFIIAVGGFSTLARLNLLQGDVVAARLHAGEAARFSEIAQDQRQGQGLETTLGLIDVLSGCVDKGLARVDAALDHTRRTNRTDVPDRLGICIDAYEAAGRPDEAMSYLQELVKLRKESVESDIALFQFEELAESSRFPIANLGLDQGLLVKAQSLQANIHTRLQRFIETAINAEIISGHDLYRTFRLAKLAQLLAIRNGWDEQRIASLELGAQLCNIGMMAIPARILQKRRKISSSEAQVLRDHTRYGAELLRRSKLRTLDCASAIAEQHHEHYDGSGYPHGLVGREITDEARVVAICDAFDAMTHKRPWRPTPLTVQAAVNEIRRGAGSQFDPELADSFVDVIRREFWEHEDFEKFLSNGADEFEYVRDRARIELLLEDSGQKPMIVDANQGS